MKIQKVTIILTLIILSLLLTGCSSTKKDDNKDLAKKVDTEIEYMDSELIKIMSKLNNINFSSYILESRSVDVSSDESTSQNSSSEGGNSQSGGESQTGGDEGTNDSGNKNTNQKINVTEMVSNSLLNIDYNDIKWDEISSDLEVFNTSWNTIILDLYKLNINNVDITSFSNTLNQLLINIKNKDKSASLSSAATLYSYIPKYLNVYSSDSAIKDLAETKLHILNSYVGATIADWTYSDNELSLAEQAFSNVMKNVDFVNQKEYNVNKVYIALKELQSSNQYKDTSIFFLKYRNLIQEIDLVQKIKATK